MAELAQEMEDNIWTVRRRRDLGPCRASQRTRRAGRPWNVHHFVTEPGASAKDAAMGGGHHQAGPGQGGDEGEAAGAAGDAVATCGDYNKGHHKFLATAQNPADEPGPGAPAPQELGAADKHGGE
nr:putative golgin subfamily A member 8D isoform X3 [Macaca nemestrina]